MSEIKNLKPECIWRNFDLLTQVPRPSGHLEKIQKFLLNFAEKAGVEAFKDPAGNIVMKKPASPGMENRKGIILQAHMDMVPQKAPASDHNFETDPIETRIEGDWVYANNTTLGSDDGMGVAAIMAIMEDKTLKHGPLNALITADEETSMVGANALPAGELEGEILLNLDTETEGEMIIGSAGGVDVTAEIEYKEIATDTADKAVKIVIDGLHGGHSGLEIGLGLANANKLMARIAVDIIANLDARLATWNGGNMRNAIPRTCEAVFTVPAENVDELKDIAAEYKDTFCNEYKGIETGITVTTEDAELPETQIPEEIADNVINAINACHNGVLRYIPSIPEIVETSSNLAIVNIGDGKASVKILARSASESQKEYIASILESAFCMAGMKVVLSGSYGGWDPNPDSEMIKVMSAIYEREFGNKPVVNVVHAGLECSVILSKYPGLDIVSTGPTLEHPHTPQERCQISTMWKFWHLIRCTLEEVPEK
ncbi:MAG: aminoacyl-histidine dipeptidase [Bacteroidales bacterium]|nr:aminoacyl-histidine dipeptidase [Bacteroidales bacterium]MCM1147608.1 aminoacyl-histidine dipeptidase [Bacteroidales bacterium]MCM1206399.1 aminoacyl-histidine dipeptidase [Bacillota bacterium]MCM1509133.1 aminoacyl-histidine dipeptidase [Clostridium sp.]